MEKQGKKEKKAKDKKVEQRTPRTRNQKKASGDKLSGSQSLVSDFVTSTPRRRKANLQKQLEKFEHAPLT